MKHIELYGANALINEGTDFILSESGTENLKKNCLIAGNSYIRISSVNKRA